MFELDKVTKKQCYILYTFFAIEEEVRFTRQASFSLNTFIKGRGVMLGAKHTLVDVMNLLQQSSRKMTAHSHSQLASATLKKYVVLVIYVTT